MSVAFVGKCPVTTEIKLDNKLCECKTSIIIKVKCKVEVEEHKLVSVA